MDSRFFMQLAEDFVLVCVNVVVVVVDPAAWNIDENLRPRRYLRYPISCLDDDTESQVQDKKLRVFLVHKPELRSM